MSWQRIRLLRAHPPGRVHADAERAAVFHAALEQAEQLTHAAETVGTAAQPLPLYYALSQAGRAIAAARLDPPWRLARHGLHEAKTQPPGLLRRQFIVDADNSQDRHTSFAGVSLATGSELPPKGATFEIGELWAAMPDLTDPVMLMPAVADTAWRRPLRLYLRPPLEGQKFAGRLLALVGDLPNIDATTAEIDEELQHYAFPVPVGVTQSNVPVQNAGPFSQFDPHWKTPSGIFARAAHADGPLYGWEGRERLPVLIFPGFNLAPGFLPPTVDHALPGYPGRPYRMIPPRIAGGHAVTPLMTWWMLLYSLSIVARYDPEVWVAALDLTEPTAVPIEVALAGAITALPRLILEALTREPADQPLTPRT